MNRLFKELSVIEFDVSDNKNIYMVNVRDVKNVQKQKKFDSLDDAMKYYKSLDSVKSVAPKEEIKNIVVKSSTTEFPIGEDIVRKKDIAEQENIDEKKIRDYLGTVTKEGCAYEKSKTSARHLNSKLKTKYNQKYINYLLGL